VTVRRWVAKLCRRLGGTRANPRALRAMTVGIVALWAGGVAAAGCTDVLGPGGCEVIYVVSQSGGTPDTGLRVQNHLSGGLDVTVEGGRIVGAGSNMASGACEIWGLFPGTYTMTLQQCAQDVAGSSQCTASIGQPVVRTVQVPDGQIVEMIINAQLFP